MVEHVSNWHHHVFPLTLDVDSEHSASNLGPRLCELPVRPFELASRAFDVSEDQIARSLRELLVGANVTNQLACTAQFNLFFSVKHREAIIASRHRVEVCLVRGVRLFLLLKDPDSEVKVAFFA